MKDLACIWIVSRLSEMILGTERGLRECSQKLHIKEISYADFAVALFAVTELSKAVLAVLARSCAQYLQLFP